MTGARLAVAALIAAALAVVVVVARGGGAIPDAPVPVAWDREPCAYCHMQVGDPRHAAQLVDDQGEVANFDDVGCAVRYVRERAPAIHRLWFHGEGDAWIAADEVGFVVGAAGATPMASGLVAVPAGTPGARSFASVLEDAR